VALEEIKGHFPQGTTLEDYWTANLIRNTVPINKKYTENDQIRFVYFLYVIITWPETFD
jgi:hypothetical protein